METLEASIKALTITCDNLHHKKHDPLQFSEQDHFIKGYTRSVNTNTVHESFTKFIYLNIYSI